MVEKFREFTDHYIKYVESFGKQAVVWGALTHANGDTKVKNKGVLMDIWFNGYADPVEMKSRVTNWLAYLMDWFILCPQLVITMTILIVSTYMSIGHPL